MWDIYHTVLIDSYTQSDQPYIYMVCYHTQIENTNTTPMRSWNRFSKTVLDYGLESNCKFLFLA